MVSPYPDVRTIAIAPAINLSGTRDFDLFVVSDTLFGELSQVNGLNILPLNKTLAAMERLGIRSIDDPKTAQKLADAVGADLLVIPAVTAYDPYNPPVIGLILQLYTSTAGGAPVVKTDVAHSNAPSIITLDGAGGGAQLQQPVSMVNAVFNAANQSVRREMHNYAVGRTEYGTALEEQRYLMDIDAYMRFCCHAMARRLMDVERSRSSDR
jgi:hypothetical protein